MELTLYVVAAAAAFGFCFVYKLTAPEGLLASALLRFEEVMRRVLGLRAADFTLTLLRCEQCVAGWSAMIASAACGLWWQIVPNAFLAMTLARFFARYLLK